jgi:uncharacterized membrane protein YjgN (DUF898 family)
MTALDAAGHPPSVPLVPQAPTAQPTAAPAPQAPAPQAPAASAAPERPPGSGGVRFLGDERAYWRLMIRGALLLAVTLGIYRFWLATDQRRFLWSNTEIAGDTLEYTGTARELLIGFLIALAVLVPLNTAFFLAAIDFGFVTFATFLVLALFGHFAIYRARRYRLTRTVFRGVRLHQTGSAWLYAVYSMLGWAAIIATFGLAYPWAQAVLERYKMHHTHYGSLRGRFVGSGTRLFFQGLIMWLLVMGPLLVGVLVLAAGIDWKELSAAVSAGGDNVWSRIESSSPNVGGSVAFMILAGIWSTIAAGLLYPVFQAMTLRWWVSGLRFGEMSATSHLRTGQMYRVYLSFMGHAFVYSLVAGVAATILTGGVTLVSKSFTTGDVAEIAGVVAAAFVYVVAMLGYSTIYQVIVRQRMWRLSFETAELSGLHALDNVKAAGAASSAFGEGLADALDVGGL